MTETPTNSVLEVKLDYIQQDIKVIKSDVKEMKSEYITRREFEEKSKENKDAVDVQFDTINEKVSLLNRVLYWVIGVLALAAATSFFKLIFK